MSMDKVREQRPDVERYLETPGFKKYKALEKVCLYVLKLEALLTETQGICEGCDSSKERCDNWKKGGAKACCPDCKHGPTPPPEVDERVLYMVIHFQDGTPFVDPFQNLIDAQKHFEKVGLNWSDVYLMQTIQPPPEVDAVVEGVKGHVSSIQSSVDGLKNGQACLDPDELDLISVELSGIRAALSLLTETQGEGK